MEKSRTCRLRRAHGLSVMAACALFCWTAAAKDVTWAGATGANWDTSSQNWVLTGTTTPAKFANGDNVTFDDTASRFECRITTSVKPASITFNNGTDYFLWTSINQPIQAGSGPTDKYGTGTLFLSNSVSASTSDVHIWKGTVKNLAPNQHYSFGGARRIYVHDGARLWLAARNSSGDVSAGRMDVVVYTNGVIDLNKPEGGVCPVKSLTLDGGTFVSGYGHAVYGTIKIEEKLAVRGTAPYVFTNSLNASGVPYDGQCITLGYNSATTFDIADITGGAETADAADDLPDATFCLPFLRASGWNAPYGCRDIVKRGPGRMTIAVTAQTGNYAPGGRWLVEEGTLEFNEQYSLCNTVTNPVCVLPGARLVLSQRNALCGANPNVLARPIVVDHGTFEVRRAFQKLGPLTLDHAAFVYTNTSDFVANYLGVLEFGTNLTVIAEDPVTLTPASNPTPARVTFHFAPDTVCTDIHVDAISGNAGADLTIDHVLDDCVSALYANANGVTTARTTKASGFIKTGTGTLLLTERNSSYSGRTEIREGTVVLDRPGYSSSTFGTGNKTYLGNMATAGRQIIVTTNGTLRINQRNIFQSMSEAGNPNLKAELVVRGGTLTCAAGAGSAIGNITFDDATWNRSSGNSNWGFWQLNHTFTLTGTRPYDFPIVSGSPATEAITIAPGTASTFAVDDITGDDAVDASFGFYFTQPRNENRRNYVYGFTKAGAGTLRLASTYSDGYRLNGTNDVTAGTLQVDTLTGLDATRLTLVRAGAYLSGTGKVTNVEIAAGGGFAATAGQKGMLTIAGDATVPATGVVEIANPRGMDTNRILVKFATVAGTLTIPDDLSGWTVKVDGVTMPPGFALLRQGNTLVAGCVQGTMLIFR